MYLIDWLYKYNVLQNDIKCTHFKLYTATFKK